MQLHPAQLQLQDSETYTVYHEEADYKSAKRLHFKMTGQSDKKTALELCSETHSTVGYPRLNFVRSPRTLSVAVIAAIDSGSRFYERYH